LKIVVLTGAGISAESGLKTFRDSNGLWEGHDVMRVASPKGFADNPALVLDFYNQRRRQLLEVAPNEAHKALAQLEKTDKVIIITQNVDDLHERAGSTKVIHLHGQLLKAKSENDDDYSISINGDSTIGDLCPKGHQMRPAIVWFGEAVPLIENAAELVEGADAILIVGTSMLVYPAADLIQYAKPDAQIVFVDPKPAMSPTKKIHSIPEKASTGVAKAISFLKC
jgi:NAD-dependent deacetylase